MRSQAGVNRAINDTKGKEMKTVLSKERRVL